MTRKVVQCGIVLLGESPVAIFEPTRRELCQCGLFALYRPLYDGEGTQRIPSGVNLLCV